MEKDNIKQTKWRNVTFPQMMADIWGVDINTIDREVVEQFLFINESAYKNGIDKKLINFPKVLTVYGNAPEFTIGNIYKLMKPTKNGEYFVYDDKKNLHQINCYGIDNFFQSITV